MWLWDSCYRCSPPTCCLARASYGHTLGWEYLQSVLLGADAAGGIAIEHARSIGKEVKQTQPPLLAWAVHENYLAAVAAGGAAEEASSAAVGSAAAELPAVDFNGARTLEDEPLLCWLEGRRAEWTTAEFDGVDPGLAAVDFSVLAARESRYVAQMHALLGNASAAAHWGDLATNLSSAVHAELWDERRGFYFDQATADGRPFSASPPSPGCSTLAARPAAAPRPLLDAIADPKRSVPRCRCRRSRATTSFDDMWRGPMAQHHHVVLALLAQNQTSAAATLWRTARHRQRRMRRTASSSSSTTPMARTIRGR